MVRRTLMMLCLMGGSCGLLPGCSVSLPAVIEDVDPQTPIVTGRVVTVITGETSRRYAPKVRFFELENQATNQRYNVDIDAQDKRFVIAIPAGDYRVNRVQISEGPFMSMAALTSSFSVEAESVTDVGTWRFGVESPRYGRMLVVSMVFDEDETSQAGEFLEEQYPTLEKEPMAKVMPQPSLVEARLYEVMPYPRYPRYFRRHLW